MPRKANAGTELPAGFKAVNVEGNFGDIHDFDKAAVLSGECVSVQEVKTKNGKTRIMTVRKADGVLAGVWEAYMLAAMFDLNPKGKQVYIHLTGHQRVKGRKEPMKLYSCGVK